MDSNQKAIASSILNLQRCSRVSPQLREALRAGHYHELVPNFYYPREKFLQLQLHEKRWLSAYAAGLASSRSVLTGRSAARLLGIWVVTTTEEVIEMALTSKKVPASRAKDARFQYRTCNLREAEVGVLDCVAVTRHARTFMDIAAQHGFAEGLVAIDYLLAHGWTKKTIEDAVESRGRFKGIAVVRLCLRYAVANSDSAFESYARALLIEAGIEDLVTQFQVGVFRADICIAGWLLVEVDGRSKYDGPGGRDLMYKDQLRQREIENQGFVFRRYTPEFLLKNPDRFIAEVKEAMRLRDNYR